MSKDISNYPNQEKYQWNLLDRDHRPEARGIAKHPTMHRKPSPIGSAHPIMPKVNDQVNEPYSRSPIKLVKGSSNLGSWQVLVIPALMWCLRSASAT